MQIHFLFKYFSDNNLAEAQVRKFRRIRLLLFANASIVYVSWIQRSARSFALLEALVEGLVASSIKTTYLLVIGGRINVGFLVDDAVRGLVT